MIFGEIESVLAIVGRIRRWLRRNPEAPVQETIASRFVRLFEAHGVHRNQIPRFLGHGLELKHIENDEALFSVLNDEMLDAAAKLFSIRREWLDGASDQIYPLHDFYKHPHEFVKFVDGMVQNSDRPIHSVVLVGETSEWDLDTLLILEETIGWIGEKPIYRHHLCSNWIFSYWKSRAYLTACVAYAFKSGGMVLGRRVDIGLVRGYREGTELLEYGVDGGLPTGGIHWYPEDMALHPSAFLSGLDEGDFGDEQGLKLWLQLADEGLMDAGFQMASVRREFEVALKKYAGKKTAQHRGQVLPE